MRRTLAAVVAAVVLTTGCTTGQGVATSPPAPPGPATQSPGAVALPSPIPSTGPSTPVLHTGTLAPGTYRIADQCCVGEKGLYLTVPAGWETIDPIFVGKNAIDDPEGLYDILVGAALVGNVYTGGCQWRGTALNPPVGPTVDDLATALVAHGGPDTAAPTDVTISGHPGKRVELSIPADIDVTTCDTENTFPVFARWSPPDAPDAGAPWTYGSGQRNTVYIVDVDGTRQVIYTMYLPGTSAANLAELEGILASIGFEP